MSGPSLVVASAARTTTGNSGALDAPNDARLVLAVAVTAASGTAPSLDVTVEWSMDGGATFCAADTADSMAQLATAVNRVKSFSIKGDSYRVVWTIGGTTPSFTFTVREMGLT